jgi:predicted amidophosphoribosyltransferase
LANELGRHTGVPVSDHLLTRSIATPPQVSLGARDRFLNVRGAFACQSGHLNGLSVVLIDDVITTGATMRACAEALVRSGASQVWGLALAGDPRPC